MLNFFFALVIGMYVQWARGMSLDELEKNIPFCKKEIKQTLAKMLIKDHWHELITFPEVKIFRAPTNQIGVWAQLEVHSPFIKISLTSSFLSNFLVILPTCSMKFQTQKKVEKSNLKNLSTNAVTDLDIETIVKEKRKGIFYLFSYGMGFSVKYIEVMRKVASKTNFPLFLVEQESGAQHKTIKDSMVLAQAYEFQARGMLHHLPAFFIFEDGKISPLTHFGANDEIEWLNQINQDRLENFP